jgi:hypothetical protein
MTGLCNSTINGTVRRTSQLLLVCAILQRLLFVLLVAPDSGHSSTPLAQVIRIKAGVSCCSCSFCCSGLFIIAPDGTLRQKTVNDLPVGRSVDETLRLVKAFQVRAQH